jgi:hypothetical protein
VSRCCSPGTYESFFDEKLARRDAEQYRRRGLGKADRRLVEVISDRGIRGASILELGGGNGTLQIELLERGASEATNAELSPAYEATAEALLHERGLEDRVTRVIGNAAEEPELVAGADIVLLHRVVCCYPDYERLLGVAADKARQLVAFSFPPDNAAARAFVGVLNLGLRIRRRDFRSYVHPREAMLDVLRGRGFEVAASERSGVWQLAVLERG